MGGWTETRPVSLGLLPSGPDPVGEWYVQRQPPGLYLDHGPGFRKFGILAAFRREFRKRPNNGIAEALTGRELQISLAGQTVLTVR